MAFQKNYSSIGMLIFKSLNTITYIIIYFRSTLYKALNTQTQTS